MKEIWKPYVSVDGNNYAVSCYGKVYSFVSKKYLKQSYSSGYIVYGSVLSSQHRLVAKVFLGEIPEGYQVNHIDGNKHNNHVSNLEIVTASENIKHAFRIGLMKKPKGELNGMSVLTEKDILQMYDMFSVGKNNLEVASVFGVNDRYVSLVRHGRRWKYLYNMVGKKFPKSYNYKISKSSIVFAKNLIDEGYRNIEIEKITGIEKSMISRIRTGDCYKDFLESYFDILATTIETTPRGGRE